MNCGLCYEETDSEYKGQLNVRPVCDKCLNLINIKGLYNPQKAAFQKYAHVHYKGRYWLLIPNNK